MIPDDLDDALITSQPTASGFSKSTLATAVVVTFLGVAALFAALMFLARKRRFWPFNDKPARYAPADVQQSDVYHQHYSTPMLENRERNELSADDGRAYEISGKPVVRKEMIMAGRHDGIP